MDRSLALMGALSRRTWQTCLRLHLLPPVAAMLIYWQTLAPGIYGYDSAELATGAYTLGIVHPTGYPIYLLLAKLFTYLPMGTIAYRVNLASAAFGALTVWMTTHVAYRLTRNRAAAWLAGGTLAVAYSFWNMSVVAEVYTLHTLFLALSVWLALKWRQTARGLWLDLCVLVFGLSLTNHVTGLLFAPGLAALLWDGAGKETWLRRAPRLGLVFLLGLTPYLYLPLRQQSSAPLNYVQAYYRVDLRTPAGLLWMISGQAYGFFAFAYDLAGYVSEIGRALVHVWRNFTGLGVIVGVFGALHLMRRHRSIGLGLGQIFAGTLVFFSGYGVADKATMFLPAYVVMAVWIGVGARSLSEVLESKLSRSSWLEAARHSFMASLALMVLVAGIFNWGWVDKSESIGAEAFARQVLATVEPDALIIGEWSSAVALEYYQAVEGLRPDVVVFNRSRFEVASYYKLWKAGWSHSRAVQEISALERAYVRASANRRPIYGTEYDPALAADYEYLPVGNLFQLIPKEHAPDG